MPTHCRNCLTTNCMNYISSALSFLPLLHGRTTMLPEPLSFPQTTQVTATSLQIPPPAKSGSTLPPTNLDDLPKASPTIASTPPTPPSSSPSPKSHATNAQPMHDSSAVFARRNLNHIAPASPSDRLSR